jgi:hypothetical protein
VLSPGCYNSTVNPSGTLTLNPGVYVLIGDQQGNNAVRIDAPILTSNGGEVLFYITCRSTYPEPCNGQAPGNFTVTAGGTVDLTGHSGYAEMLLWVDRTADATSARGNVTFGGSAAPQLRGSIYNFGGHVDLSGGSSGTTTLNVTVLANTIRLTGGAEIDMPWDPQLAPVEGFPALTE